MIHKLSRMRYVKSINLFVGVILCHISPKAFPKEYWYCGAYQWFKLSLYHLGGRGFFHLFLVPDQSLLSVVEFHLSFEMFSISPLQAFSFYCWFSNNSVLTFFEGCLPSSFVAEVVIFFSILLFQWYIFYCSFRRNCVVALFVTSTHFAKIIFFSS